MKLNLGCGSHAPHGWVNVDYALGARFAKDTPSSGQPTEDCAFSAWTGTNEYAFTI